MIQISGQQFNIALTMTTNGRWDCLKKTIERANEVLFPYYDFDYTIIVEDSGRDVVWWRVAKLCKDFDLVLLHPEPLGLAKTVQDSWQVPDYIDYTFHLEDDFMLNETPPIGDMIAIMELNQHLSQVILKRQPVNDAEIAAGGYIGQNLDAYTEKSMGNLKWLEHHQFFSLNPGVIHRSIFADIGWPESNEAGMTEKLNNMGYSHGIWGTKFSNTMVEHIGHYRPEWWKL